MKALVRLFQPAKASSRGLLRDCATSIFAKVCFQLLSSLPRHSQRWGGGRPSGNWYPETAFKDSHLICFIAVSLPAPLCINGLTWMPCILHIQLQTYSFRVRLDSTSVYLYYMKYYAFIKTDNKPFVIPFRSNYCIVLIVSILFMKEWLSVMPCLH